MFRLNVNILQTVIDLRFSRLVQSSQCYEDTNSWMNYFFYGNGRKNCILLQYAMFSLKQWIHRKFLKFPEALQSI